MSRPQTKLPCIPLVALFITGISAGCGSESAEPEGAAADVISTETSAPIDSFSDDTEAAPAPDTAAAFGEIASGEDAPDVNAEPEADAPTDVPAAPETADAVEPIEIAEPNDSDGPDVVEADIPVESDTCASCECAIDADCPPSPTACKQLTCLAGTCVPGPIPGCCVENFECDDDSECTQDFCVESACTHPPLPGLVCCAADPDCDDGAVCTVDHCALGVCANLVVEPACCAPGASCDDGDPCTDDSCVTGYCQHLAAVTPAACCSAELGCNAYTACAAPPCAPYTFSAIGDIPYTPEENVLLAQWIAAENALDPKMPFMVHLGDIKAGFFVPCTEDIYALVAGLLKASQIPIYIVPGDNEWNDCFGDVDGAWKLWAQYFMAFETGWANRPPTEHQVERPENMAFVSGPAVFVGLNLPGGFVHDAAEWETRMAQNVAFIGQQLEKHADYPIAVVFAQAEPSGSNTAFFDGLRAAAVGWNKPILYLHGDGHEYKVDQPWAEQNLFRIEVPANGAKPLHITIDPALPSPFSINATPF